MCHAPTDPPYMPPLPAGQATLPAPELMAIVMRRVGEGCSLDDFKQAAETCDLGEPRLRANLGAAKRILLMETERQVFPLRPLNPWDADPSYRADRIAEGARLVVAALEAAHYCAAEIKALGPAITAATLAKLTTTPAGRH